MFDLDILYRSCLSLGAIGTLIGALLVHRTLRANHDWARRRYAISMVKQWNENVYPHFRVIENFYPHIRQFDEGEGKYSELTHDTAKNLWKCDPEDSVQWEVKTAIMELLNYFDFIATAYSQNVADSSIIIHSFEKPLTQWHDILTNFIKAAEKGLGFQPWETFLNVVATWKSPNSTARKKTA